LKGFFNRSKICHNVGKKKKGKKLGRKEHTTPSSFEGGTEKKGKKIGEKRIPLGGG